MTTNVYNVYWDSIKPWTINQFPEAWMADGTRISSLYQLHFRNRHGYKDNLKREWYADTDYIRLEHERFIRIMKDSYGFPGIYIYIMTTEQKKGFDAIISKEQYKPVFGELLWQSEQAAVNRNYCDYGPRLNVYVFKKD